MISVTEPRKEPSSVNMARDSHSLLPIEPHLEIPTNTTCPLSWGMMFILTLNIMTILAYHCTSENKPLQRQMEALTEPSGSVLLTLYSQCLLQWLRQSCTIKEGQQATWGSGLCLHSSLDIAHLLCCQIARSPREEEGGNMLWGIGDWDRLNDMPLSECIISFWQTIDSSLVFVTSCKASAMAAVNPGWTHLTY